MDFIFNIIKNKKPTDDEINESQRLVNIGYDINDFSQREKIFNKAFILNPQNGNALMQLSLINIGNKDTQDIGYFLLEKAFDNSFASPYIHVDCFQGEFLLKLMGRYNCQKKNYNKSKKFFQQASNSYSKKDDVANVQLATLLTGYPKSVIDAKNIIKEQYDRLNHLINLNSINISSAYNDNDPYLFCILSAFNLEIYYEADFKDLMNKRYKLSIKIFPELNYKYPINYSINSINCNKYKIAIASAFFYENNSVLSDFRGVMDRLPRDKFDITFINFKEPYMHDSQYLEDKKYDKTIIVNTKNDDLWLEKARERIGFENFDLILYLDSTMSVITSKILMSKLAKVQAVTHGHPVTSGVDSDIVDYYVSWEGAELDYEKSKHHYTEKLILLPGSKMHQYYEPRTKKGISNINNKRFDNLTREDFSSYVPSSGNWYICMQKPFKRHPEFDKILARILEKDTNGRLLLHDGDNDEIINIVKERLINENINMDRVHFIPQQEHNKLMALYKLSDVILDSYYAGGCTTTREALEIGGLVVTLPDKYLGSRWSFAYYNIIGVTDLIAKNKDDYINIAVNIATNKIERDRIKNLVLNNINKIFYSNDAIESWTNVLETMINSVKNKSKKMNDKKNEITLENIDKYLTIGIKTFNRPLCLKNCIEQIRKIYKNIKIIIADDSDKDIKEENKKYIDANTRIIDLSYNIGVSKGRNSIVNMTDTKYYLTLDDDNYINNKTNLIEILNFMEINNDISLIGGICDDRKIYGKNNISYTYTFASIYKNDIYCCNNFIKLDDKLDIYKTDITLQLFIAKTQVLKDFPWDNDLSFEEHKPFFVNLYKNNINCAISNKFYFREITDNRRNYINISSPYKRINHNIKYNLIKL